MTRIAFGTAQRGWLNTLGQIGSALGRSLSHLAAGKRVTSAGEDGGAAARIAALNEDLARLDARRRAIGIGRGFLGATDAALASAQDLLNSAITEAVKGASGTNAHVRGEIATQVDALREQMIFLARSRYQDRYIFSGTETLTVPFDAAGVYQGDGGSIRAQVDDQLAVVLNVPGDRVFRSGVDILGTLGDLSVALRAGDEAAIRTAETDLRSGVDQVAAVRASVGARLWSLEAADENLLAREVTLRDELGRLEDADIPAEETRAVRLQTASQATMTIIARQGNRSLFDYYV